MRNCFHYINTFFMHEKKEESGGHASTNSTRREKIWFYVYLFLKLLFKLYIHLPACPPWVVLLRIQRVWHKQHNQVEQCKTNSFSCPTLFHPPILKLTSSLTWKWKFTSRIKTQTKKPWNWVIHLSKVASARQNYWLKRSDSFQ